MSVFFSFGGGVQSCAIAGLLIDSPDVFNQIPDLILFADTGAEPPRIYKQVEIVFNRLRDSGFTCEVVKAGGSILDEPVNGRGGLSTIPFYARHKGKNEVGMLRRQCTNEFKIQPIHKRIREYLGVKPRHRVKGNHVLWLGISTEEIRRATQPKESWLTAEFPLIELRMDRTRAAIKAYEVFGFAPEKSSCFMCPFTHPQEWMRRKEEDPELFKLATDFDSSLSEKKAGWGGVNSPVYIHPSGERLIDCVPSQPRLFPSNFQKDCGGYCWG